VLRLVVGTGARLAFFGIAAGTAVALALTRLMTDLLYGVRPADPVTFKRRDNRPGGNVDSCLLHSGTSSHTRGSHRGLALRVVTAVLRRRRTMSLLRNIVSGLRSLFRKEQVDRELDQELRAYLEMAADEKIKQGMSRQGRCSGGAIGGGERRCYKGNCPRRRLGIFCRDVLAGFALRFPHAAQESRNLLPP